MNRKGLVLVSLLLVVVMLGISVVQVNAGLRERIEYRVFRTATATLTALPYPIDFPTYTPAPQLPYPTPMPTGCPVWWLCVAE